MAIPKEYGDYFTYKQYRDWPDEERWELINGVAYNMCAAPSTEHQRVSRKLLRLIDNYLDGKPCEIFHAPFDVRLPEGKEIDDDISTVVQPDLAIICDPSKLDARGCKGAPDFIIEILSPHTGKKDRQEKRLLYAQHGVKEYWIVSPYYQLVETYILSEERNYITGGVYNIEDIVKTDLFPGMEIDLKTIFQAESS